MSKRVCAQRISFENHEYMDQEQQIQRKSDGTPIPVFRVAFKPPASISKECERLCDENELNETLVKNETLKNEISQKVVAHETKKAFSSNQKSKIQLFDDAEEHCDFLKRKDFFEKAKSDSLHAHLLQIKLNHSFFEHGSSEGSLAERGSSKGSLAERGSSKGSLAERGSLLISHINQNYVMEDETIKNQFSLNVQRGKESEKKFMDVMKTFDFMVKQGSKLENMKKHIDFYVAWNTSLHCLIYDRRDFIQYFIDYVQNRKSETKNEQKPPLIWCDESFPCQKWISVDVKGAKSCFGKVDPAAYTVIETEGVNMGKTKSNLGWLYCSDGPEVIAFDLLTHFMLVERSKIQTLVELARNVPCSEKCEDGMVYFEQTSAKNDLYFTVPCLDLAKIAFGFVSIE